MQTTQYRKWMLIQHILKHVDVYETVKNEKKFSCYTDLKAFSQDALIPGIP